jgi:hypothetical protein
MRSMPSSVRTDATLGLLGLALILLGALVG